MEFICSETLTNDSLLADGEGDSVSTSVSQSRLNTIELVALFILNTVDEMNAS